MKKAFILFSLCLYLFSVHASDIWTPTRETALRAPSVPLITSDTYFSIWSPYNELTEGNTEHWTGAAHPLLGTLRVDGTVYRFMGKDQVRLDALQPMADAGLWEGRYTFERPEKGWMLPAYNASAWKSGKAAFGTKDMKCLGTEWNTDDIWIRRTFQLTEDLSREPLFVRYSHDDVFELYLNGEQLVATDYSWKNNVLLELSAAAKKKLVKGDNVLAAHCHNTTGGAYVDFGLYKKPAQECNFSRVALQKSVDVLPTQTYYTFTCGPVELDLIFTAPLLMEDFDLISTPINYLSYRVHSTDRKQHNVQIYIETTPQLAVHETSQPTITECLNVKGMNYAKSGTIDQPYTVRKGDGVRIDWGYAYLGAPDESDKAVRTGSYYDMKQSFITNGQLLPPTSARIISRNENEMPAMAYSHDLKQVGKEGKSSFIMLGYDDIYSLEYFYQRRQAYWKHNGKVTIFDAFECYQAQHAALMERCRAFDAELMANAEQAGGKQYAELCALVYRQAITAHKLFTDEAGNVLFFSKENHSNGCINTVDITYPSAPLFLLYNPDLLKGMMTSIFHYSESGRWTKPFPAHDLGTYPVANGLEYGGDMPIEEAGNMVILTAAISLIEGNANYAAQHWETLTTWANYLYENGLDPENQICTDDFAGHLAHNANLSVKAILAIAGYSEVARMLGKDDIAAKYMNAARNMAIEWEKMARDDDHYKLAFDKAGTWSLKYNLIWDKAFGTNLFPSQIFEKEMDFYLKSQHKYGTPLDSRKNYTKSDWIMWSACLRDEDDFRRMIAPVYLNAEETPSRVPISDWYDADHGEMMNFKARSVVGGFFMKLLLNKMNSRKTSISSKTTSGNPVFPGWYADPEGVVFNNEYWIYPTLSLLHGEDALNFPAEVKIRKTRAVNQDYNIQTYMDAFSSKDLVNWTKHPKVLSIENIPWLEFALWAPAVVEANGKYYLFFGGNDIQNNEQLGGIGVAVADSPAGPFKDALGKPLIDKIINGAQPIDQFVFKDDDGQYYMYYGGWGHCNMVKLSPDLLSVVPFEDGSMYKEVTPERYTEGPFMMKRNGKYYFMWSEGGWGGPDYCVAYAIADSPFGPFKRIGKILEQDDKVATGAGHHSLIQVPGKDEWYIVYHRHPLDYTNASHRVTCIDPLYFDNEGFIKPVKITNEGVKPCPIK